MSEWIAVEDRLPECDGYYLCYLGDNNHSFFQIQTVPFGFNQKVWHCGDDSPTHWQPLPTPPQGDER